MKKLFIFGVVGLVGLASCKSATCPAYSRAGAAQNHATEMAKTAVTTDQNRN